MNTKDINVNSSKTETRFHSLIVPINWLIFNLNSVLSFYVTKGQNDFVNDRQTTTLFPFRPTKFKLAFDDDTETNKICRRYKRDAKAREPADQSSECVVAVTRKYF